MRSVVVHADKSPSGAARIESALSLARMTGAHVTLLVDTPITRLVSVDPMGGTSFVSDAIENAVAEDDEFARQIEARMARGDVACDVLRAETEPVEALADVGRLADVAVVSRDSALAADLALATRCPVLAVNADRPLNFPLGKVAVAWDGSAEAAYALRCAVPLLGGGAEVTVLTVEDAPEILPAIDAVTYLSRHGIRAEMQALQRVGAIEATLERELQLLETELLVMGAFTHSRLREFLFGGVTRYFLECKHGPALFLGH